MRNDYYPWRLSNQNSDNFAYLIRTNHINIKCMQHIKSMKQYDPCNFKNDKIQL